MDLQAPALHVHPLVLDAILISTTALITGFTAAESLLRPAFLPIILTCLWLSIPSSFEGVYWKYWRSLLASEMVVRSIHYVEIALVTRWTYEADGPSQPNRHVSYANKKKALVVGTSKGPGGWLERLSFGFAAALNHRCNGTPVEVKNVPFFLAGDPSFIPSRRVFLRSIATRGTLCYLLLDIMTSGDRSGNKETFVTAYVPFFSRLTSITMEESITRIVVSAASWLSIYLVIETMRCTIAFISVMFHFSEVSSWRPMFGSFSDAYTLRNFWGSSWHQMQRQRFGSPAGWFTYELMKLPEGSIPGRYMSMFLVFFLSGLVHTLSELATGAHWSESGTMRFFLTHNFGIIIEDSLHEIAKRFNINLENKTKKLIGYLWVVLFMAWSVPGWMYPILSTTTNEPGDDLLPFSFVKAFGSMLPGAKTT